MASSTKICKKELDETNRLVRFNFVGAGTVVAYLDDLPQEMVNRLALHGLSAKLGDSYAGAPDSSVARDGVEVLYAALCNGDWSTARESTGGIIVEALSRITGEDVAAVKDMWDVMDEAKQKAIAKEPQVALVVAEINLERKKAKAEKATGGLNLGGLFPPKAE